MTKMIKWIEIPAKDFDRAVNFYNMVFKMKLKKKEFEHEKMACFPGGEGAISFSPGFEPSDKGILVSFSVPDSIEETQERIETNGGFVVKPKMKIDADGQGYFSTFKDTEGNIVGLYSEN